LRRYQRAVADEHHSTLRLRNRSEQERH
jgi:hypothetical protein